MAEYRNGSHTVYDIKYHFVWITKYRYKVLKGPITLRLRELLKQGCEAKGLKVLKGSIGSDHVHMLLSCPTNLSPSQIAQYLKGRSSHLIQDEFPELKKRYWGQNMWARGYFCGTVGEVDGNVISNFIKTIKTLETAWFQRFLRLWGSKTEETRIDDFAEKLVKIWYESW